MKKYLFILKDFQSIFHLFSPDNVVDYLKIKFESNSNDDSSIHFKRSTYLKYKSLLKDSWKWATYCLVLTLLELINQLTHLSRIRIVEILIQSVCDSRIYPTTYLSNVWWFPPYLSIIFFSLDPTNLSMLIHSNFDKDLFLNYQNNKTGEDFWNIARLLLNMIHAWFHKL